MKMAPMNRPRTAIAPTERPAAWPVVRVLFIVTKVGDELEDARETWLAVVDVAV